MNYGKKGSKKRQAELTSKGIVYRKKMRVIFCKVLLVCCFAVAIIGGSLGFGISCKYAYLGSLPIELCT